MVAPPKPWERTGIVPSTTPTTAPASSSFQMSPAANPNLSSTTTSSPSSTIPVVPERPAVLTSTSPYQPYSGSQFSRFGTSAYGAGYGGLGYGNLGSTYGYGGYGGYGGLGAYGGLSGLGYGSYGYGAGIGTLSGPNGLVPIGPDGRPLAPTLTQTLESTTQHTFALLHSIVQTFTGVAQMLESTFMATHSSFFAMVGVVDQFSQLRNALGSVLGLFGLLRWMKEVLTGKRSIHGDLGGSGGLNSEFREFINGRPVQGQAPPPTKASKKPIIVFLLAVFGIPYAMSKLIRVLQERAQAQAANGGVSLGQLPPLDPSSLTFARALYLFTPSNSNELALKENEIVAITGKIDPRTGVVVDPRLEVDGEWWKGRTREGREGWFPKKWVEVLQKRKLDEPKKAD